MVVQMPPLRYTGEVDDPHEELWGCVGLAELMCLDDLEDGSGGNCCSAAGFGRGCGVTVRMDLASLPEKRIRTGPK